jgi:ABC-type nitrate/sulfonate/bicarbonate transport system ATPase subunit
MKITNLNLEIDNKKILSNINMDIENYGITVILGSSGSGKSSLLKSIIGEYKHYQGSITNCNSISYMPQGNTLLPWLNVSDNITLPFELSKKEINIDNLSNIISLLKLEESKKKFPHQLSGGMKTRVMLARTFIEEKDLIILDEPFTGLDYIHKLEIYEWIKTLEKTYHKKIIIVTHDIDEAIELADIIYILSGSPSSFSKNLEKPFSKEQILQELKK